MFQHFTGLLISALAVHLGTSKEVKNYKEKNQGTGSAIKRFYISNSTVTKKQTNNKKTLCQPCSFANLGPCYLGTRPKILISNGHYFWRWGGGGGENSLHQH